MNRTGNKQKLLIPKIRFKLNNNTPYPDWQKTELKKLAKRITVKNKTATVTRVLTNSAADGVIDQRDYFDRDIANKGNLTGYYIIENGDYVYNPRISNIAPVGPISKNKIGTGVMSPLYTVFRFKNKNNGFYEQYFKSTHWHNYLHSVSNHGARHDRMSITNDNFMDMPLPEPYLDEQQKIADCLSSVDDLITSQSQKIESLQKHKKGLMQQLFPAEGETVPRVRFAEFRQFGQWREIELKNVLSYERPDKYIVSDTDYQISGTPVLTANKSFILGYTQENKGIYTNIPVIIFDDFTVDKKYVDFPFKVKSSAIKILKIKGNNNIKFVYEVMSQIQFNAGEHKRYYISAYQNLLIKVPEPIEQQKIADCLTSLDELIAAETQKLDLFKTHKKGLMQQLFPAVDEVVI